MIPVIAAKPWKGGALGLPRTGRPFHTYAHSEAFTYHDVRLDEDPKPLVRVDAAHSA